jgi:hypothetical protein
MALKNKPKNAQIYSDYYDCFCDDSDPQPVFSAYGAEKMMVVRATYFRFQPLEGVTHLVRIPEGYVFDGASIPRIAWSIVGYPFEPDLIEAACVHDWYCEHAQRYSDRTIGDTIFLKMLQEKGVSKTRRIAMYLAVRAYTLLFWRSLA